MRLYQHNSIRYTTLQRPVIGRSVFIEPRGLFPSGNSIVFHRGSGIFVSLVETSPPILGVHHAS